MSEPQTARWPWAGWAFMLCLVAGRADRPSWSSSGDGTARRPRWAPPRGPSLASWPSRPASGFVEAWAAIAVALGRPRRYRLVLISGLGGESNQVEELDNVALSHGLLTGTGVTSGSPPRAVAHHRCSGANRI
jgi:hypothetical protein